MTIFEQDYFHMSRYKLVIKSNGHAQGHRLLDKLCGIIAAVPKLLSKLLCFLSISWSITSLPCSDATDIIFLEHL